MKDDLIFVELANKKDPKRTYRLVVDLDMEKLQVRQATVSDGQGNLKKFDVTVSNAGTEAPAAPENRSVGPRKTAGPTAAPRRRPPQVQVGRSGRRKRQGPTAKLNAGPPIRVERFEPQRLQHIGPPEEG